MAKLVMVQGTCSGAGKSLLVCAICSFYKQLGLKVAPFKAQNMSLNAVALKEGEIAWAQFVQALACGVEPTPEMNPVLLKPVGDAKSELILLGQSCGFVYSATFDDYREKAKPIAFEALERLSQKFDVVVIEGAGSPVEVNLKDKDFVNMILAKSFNVPVILVADIERGGVFAQIIGTMELLDEKEKSLVKGFVINKFRGNLDILKPGLDFLEKKTGKPVLAVIPYMEHVLPPEDSLDIRRKKGKTKIAVVKYPRISNFSDLIPFWVEDVEITWATKPEELENCKAVILPGSRKVIEDLRWLKKTSIAQKISKLHRKGVSLIGICGGYQMLGKRLIDPLGREGIGEEEGLGLIEMETFYQKKKIATKVKARRLLSHPWLSEIIEGYLIKSGNIAQKKPFLLEIEGAGYDGYASENVTALHIHGIFENDRIRKNFIEHINGIPSGKSYREELYKSFETLAQLIEQQPKLYRLLISLAR